MLLPVDGSSERSAGSSQQSRKTVPTQGVFSLSTLSQGMLVQGGEEPSLPCSLAVGPMGIAMQWVAQSWDGLLVQDGPHLLSWALVRKFGKVRTGRAWTFSCPS